jgi:PAS domain S-box-containing protein
MADPPRALPPSVDPSVIGQAMLKAAQAAGIGVTITLLEQGSGRNIYVSDAAADILGWPIEELLSGDAFARIAPEDAAQMAARRNRRAAGDDSPNTYELTAIRKDGRRTSFEVTATPMEVDGRPAALALIVDLTARRAAEQATLRTEARFRGLIERAPEPIGIIRDRGFVYANPAFIASLGYPNAQALYAVSLSALLGPDDLARLETRVNAILAEGRPPPHAYSVRRYDGSAMLLETSSVPFEYEGKPSVLTMGRDVTERRALEARLVQADRLAALGTMAAGVAHEINNPLTYLIINLDWLARKLSDGARDAESTEGLAEILQEARSGAKRVATIVRELRSFSRADDDTKEAVDLKAVVRSAVKIAGHEIRPRASLSVALGAAPRVHANEGRLEQVVINLLLNAAQALPPAETATNEIRVIVRGDTEGNAVLEISDNGEGIAPEVLPRIFDPFFTTKPPGVGTGLGLSICHGIVTSLGGKITVESVPAGGTSFRVTFPSAVMSLDSEPPSPSPSVDPSWQQHHGPRARVLVVDDEIQIASTLRDLLSVDHDVTAATSAAEALAALEDGKDFDVIFCDLMMPAMSGIELYERIREKRPGLERRVVFMTGAAFTTHAAAFLASVENRCLEKPFSLRFVEHIILEMRSPSLEP